VDHYIERVVDLTEPESNLIYNMSVADARGLLFERQAEAVLQIHGSFALLAKSGQDGADGAFSRQANAVFSGQAAGGSGAHRSLSGRHDFRMAKG